MCLTGMRPGVQQAWHDRRSEILLAGATGRDVRRAWRASARDTGGDRVIVGSTGQ